MHCYRVYTPPWLWYWPGVFNVLQRLAWGKKILLHSRRSEDEGRRLSEQKPRRVQPETQGARSGSHAIGDWSEDLWRAWRAKLRSYGTCRGHVWDVGLHAHKRGGVRGVTWIAGRRRWSRYGESPRRRNVRDVKTTALDYPGGPCGLWLYQGEFCE